MHAVAFTLRARSAAAQVPATRPFRLRPVRRSIRFAAADADFKVEEQYGWNIAEDKSDAEGVLKLRVNDIRRPLARTRTNDPAKVEALMESIEQHGLKTPIDVLEVEGKHYGFSGCHRYEAFQRLGIEMIPCKVRKATLKTLHMHLM